jgi:hypothetical protein
MLDYTLWGEWAKTSILGGVHHEYWLGAKAA